jgi:hypothetical protein
LLSVGGGKAQTITTVTLITQPKRDGSEGGSKERECERERERERAETKIKYKIPPASGESAAGPAAQVGTAQPSY